MTDNKVTEDKVFQNGLLDILLNGLTKSNGLDKSALGTLSQVSKLFQNRLKQEFIWQQLPAEEPDEQPTTGFISERDRRNINDFVNKIPTEYPCAQPRDSQGWAQIDEVPRKIKNLMLALYDKVGPHLMIYVRDLYNPHYQPDESNAPELLNWLEALQALYDSAKQSPDLFHGLFLSNHNFARRAYQLAQNTSLDFSIMVLEVCAECRFSSLTMGSKQLDDFFTSLAGLYAEKQAVHRQDADFPFQVTATAIKEHIQETFYPKTLLLSWNTIKSAPLTPEFDSSLDSDLSNEITASPSFTLSANVKPSVKNPAKPK